MPPIIPLVDPAPLGELVSRLIETMLQQSAGGFNWLIEYYFLWTGNFHGADKCLFAYSNPACAFTGNDVVRGLYRLTAAMADAVLLAIVMFMFALHAAGRSLGLDAWLRRHVAAVRAGTGFFGRLLKLAS